MVHAYAESEDMGAAFRLFEHTPEPNISTRTAMVVGYAATGLWHQAKCGDNHNVAVCMSQSWRPGHREVDTFFKSLREKSLYTWNAMINGLAVHGHVEQALDVFNQLLDHGTMRPDEVTLAGAVTACNKPLPRCADICAKLEELTLKMSAEGYLAETGFVLYDIHEDEREQALGHQGEELALTLGLISTAPRVTLRTVKNLRVW
ncbi:pentatricopeptide repeat-containing protein ELI1, chloroplastic-like [Nymphaea colorata]|uniref:pentatricopeptide repeat-containing protein ELI1, chloroplastic-like n=1 Tax=Nymphaea colorata TaxID=210225 RepID=UPI00129E1E43|nr:pentatricopeptide repeat-containing protein ELI1, chloroplastic-like [Nymphaea colorata]